MSLKAESKRGCRLLEESKIADAVSFQCRCIPQCAEVWTRKVLRRARQAYLALSLKDQLAKVYDILNAYYNTDTGELFLLVLGMLKIFISTV